MVRAVVLHNGYEGRLSASMRVALHQEGREEGRRDDDGRRIHNQRDSMVEGYIASAPIQ